MTRHSFPLKSGNYSFRLLDFVINTMERVFLAFRIVLYEPPLTSWSDLHPVHLGDQPSWSPPLRDRFGVCIQLEYHGTRRIKHMRDYDFVFPRFSLYIC